MKSKYYHWSKNGMKMIIDSGYKKFDKETNCISIGNCLANTQYSNHIRPRTETECNGTKFEIGHLQDYDLKFFDLKGFESIKEFLKNISHSVVLYQFHTHEKSGERDIIGWLIEDNNKIVFEQLCGRKWGVNYEKRYNALQYARKILEEKFEQYA